MRKSLVLGAALGVLAAGVPALAGGPGPDDKSDRATETAVRAESRAQRDEIRVREDRARSETRIAEDRSKTEARMAEDRGRASADAAEKATRVEVRSVDSAKAGEKAARDAADAARAETRALEDAAKASADLATQSAKAAEDAAKDQAKASEDAAKDAADAAENAAKDAADAAEKAAKDAADAAEDQAKAAEDAAKDAADAAEDAAKAAEDAAKDAADAAEDATKDAMSGSGSDSRSDVSSSASLHDLGKSENPEFDRGGFPVRRGEVVALDLTPATRSRAEALGFRVIAETRLRSLDSSVTRLATPAGMSASDALDALRKLDSRASFDNLHYYGLLVGVAGAADGAASAMPSRKAGALRVGMIDTAVAPHPALRGTAVEARDFSTGAGAAATVHGTAVASILANEGSSTIVAANIFKAGEGQPYTSADAIVRALEWMAERNVGVINISLAGPRNAILDALIAKVAARGQIIVAAAGNGGPSAPPAYPAAVPRVVAVTAVDRAQRVYRYANQGDYIAFAATGVGVPAAAPDGGIAGFTGTSFATPHISAELARCLKTAGKRKGGQCVERMQLAARDLGAPGRDSVYGYGVID